MLKEKKKVAQTNYVIEYKGRPISQMRRSLKTAMRRAKVNKRFCMYDVRHLFATILLGDKKASLDTVSSLLGHQSKRMTYDQYWKTIMDYSRHKTVVDMVEKIGDEKNRNSGSSK